MAKNSPFSLPLYGKTSASPGDLPHESALSVITATAELFVLLRLELKTVDEDDLVLFDSLREAVVEQCASLRPYLSTLGRHHFIEALGSLHVVVTIPMARQKKARDLGKKLSLFPKEDKRTFLSLLEYALCAKASPLFLTFRSALDA